MIEKNKPHTEDNNIERHLTPRCDFRVSPGFKDRVMAEARSIRKRRRRRRILYLAFPGAAAAVAIVVMTTLHLHKMDPNVETPQITVAIENQTPTPSDTLKMNPNTTLLADATQANPRKETDSETIPTTKDRTQQPESTNSMILEEVEMPTETETQPVTEGEMPMINKDTSLDPDEVRSRLIETRRNADIAFIERMRDEIEANQAYIAQLMTEENVYQ